MRRIPIAILGCVILFLAVVAGLLFARSHGAKVHPPEPTQSKADYRIKEVHLQEDDGGRTHWQLDAESGEVFEDQGKTFMKKVTIHIDQPERAWTVNSDEGEMLRDSKDVELRGHVVVVSSDGLRIETSRLNWAAKEQRVWTDKPVTIWRSGVEVRGQGFESLVKEDTSTVKGRLRATITRDQMGQSGKGKS
jgi:LPS export ABC transporter protein LptC